MNRRVAAVALCLLCSSAGTALANVPTEFDRQWLAAVENEALARGVGAETVRAAFAGIRPLPKVIELDRRQAQGRISSTEYLNRVVTPDRVRMGRDLLARHRPLLEEVAARYGVQARFIVALWGIETNYGRFTGGTPVIPALATLAYDGRRGEFFRGELLAALRILDEGHVGLDDMQGSWAGAMGQSQFMPSTFLNYAVDHDRDGRKDIWNTLDDVFASAANYLARAGWRDDHTWGRPVRLPRSLAASELGLDYGQAPGSRRDLQEWAALGVRRADGGPLPGRSIPATLVRPDGKGGAAYLVYPNFDVIKTWNRSTLFALAVGHLADRIGGL